MERKIANADDTTDPATGEASPAAEVRPAAGSSGPRPVRVGYVDHGFGVALVVGDDDQLGRPRAHTGVDDGDAGTDGRPLDGEAGLLRVGDAVVTLEIPHPDGRRSVLSWDPAEVTLDPLVA